MKAPLKVISVFGSLLLILGCSRSSDEQKIADATAELKVFAKELSSEMAAGAKDDLNVVVDSLELAEFDGDVTVHKEWLKFKREALANIEANDKIIAAYSAGTTATGGNNMMKDSDKIFNLQKQNRALKTKLSDYRIDDKTAWEQFKSELSHDIAELGTALKDFAIENKK